MSPPSRHKQHLRKLCLFIKTVLDVVRVKPPANEFDDIPHAALLRLPFAVTAGYIVLSVKFDRGFTFPRPAELVQLLLGRSKCYSPNWFNKSDCGIPSCRGSAEICRRLCVGEDGRPTDSSCWRFSFRWHLSQRSSDGNPTVMLRIRSGTTYGLGQCTEADMAAELADDGVLVIEILDDSGFADLVLSGASWLLQMLLCCSGFLLIAITFRKQLSFEQQVVYICLAFVGAFYATWQFPGNKSVLLAIINGCALAVDKQGALQACWNFCLLQLMFTVGSWIKCFRLRRKLMHSEFTLKRNVRALLFGVIRFLVYFGGFIFLMCRSHAADVNISYADIVHGLLGAVDHVSKLFHTRTPLAEKICISFVVCLYLMQLYWVIANLIYYGLHLARRLISHTRQSSRLLEDE